MPTSRSQRGYAASDAQLVQPELISHSKGWHIGMPARFAHTHARIGMKALHLMCGLAPETMLRLCTNRSFQSLAGDRSWIGAIYSVLSIVN
jgi:hypothetical protein